MDHLNHACNCATTAVTNTHCNLKILLSLFHFEGSNKLYSEMNITQTMPLVVHAINFTFDGIKESWSFSRQGSMKPTYSVQISSDCKNLKGSRKTCNRLPYFANLCNENSFTLVPSNKFHTKQVYIKRLHLLLDLPLIHNFLGKLPVRSR